MADNVYKTPEDDKMPSDERLSDVESVVKGLETPEQQRWFFANYPEYSSSYQEGSIDTGKVADHLYGRANDVNQKIADLYKSMGRRGVDNTTVDKQIVQLRKQAATLVKRGNKLLDITNNGTSKSLYKTPKSAGLFSRGKDGITVYKGTDGLRYMFMVTSNAYRDREGETITSEALKGYVDSVWSVDDKPMPNNELLFWHKGDPIGDIIWADMEGPFLLEVAKERTNGAVKLSKSVNSTVKEVWNWIEARKEYKWQASHGFKYPPQTKEGGTYKAIRKFESSVLPRSAAANALTFSGVINDMSRDSVLEELIGLPGTASKLRKGVRALKQQLDDLGIEHKSTDGEADEASEADKAMLHDAKDVLDKAFAKVGGKVEDGYSSKVLSDIVSKLSPDDEGQDEDTETPDEETREDAAVTDKKTASAGKSLPDDFVVKQTSLLTRLIGSLETITEEQAEIRDELKQVSEQVKEMSEKSDGTVKSLEERVKALDNRLSKAPRRLGAEVANDSTVVTDEKLTQMAKEVAGTTEPLFPGSSVMIRKADNHNGSR